LDAQGPARRYPADHDQVDQGQALSHRAAPRQIGPLGAILLPGPLLVVSLLALQALAPSDAVNAGMFLAAPLGAVAAPLIAEPPTRLQLAGFAVAGFLWTLLTLTLVGLGALAVASAAHSV
jgi:hypothetical protein